MLTERSKEFLSKVGIETLRPAQEKAVAAGALEGKNVLVCTPTASGKTLIAELAIIEAVTQHKKALYLVPLKSLATEKHREFKKRHNFRTAISIGDFDSSDKNLADADVIIATAEKLDALIRHNTPWLGAVSLVVIDEIHLLNDAHRGPTLEILITMLRRSIKPQLIGLSATIGNPKELATWLDAQLVEDSWRPIRLEKGIFSDGVITYYE